MEASRAATGMLDVLATRQVRSIALYDTPSMIVSNSGKSFNTSAISFPRSPHPTYTMMSELDYLESDCEMTVLPQPNAPGTALVPPNTEGKIPSMTRCPVKRGVLAAKDSVTGLDSRTGHLWLKLNSCVFFAFCLDIKHVFNNIVLTSHGMFLQATWFSLGWNHDSMFLDAPVFENIANYIPSLNQITIFLYRFIFPLFDKVEAVHVNATWNEDRIRLFMDSLEGSLDAVENVVENARAEQQ